LGPAPERIISCAFSVTNAPGHRFVEQPSENALALEMRKCALGTVQQRGTIILYQRPQILTGRPVNICVMAGRASTRVRVGPATHVFDDTKESRGCPAGPEHDTNRGDEPELRAANIIRRRDRLLYDGVIVGEFTTGLLLKDQVIAELKVVAAPSKVHLPRCRNDLRATGKPMCLLGNFGRPKVETRRVTAEARLRKPSPSSLLIPLIRLKIENLPPHSGIACMQLGKGTQAGTAAIPVSINAG
jgi:hypothetical protein